MASDQGEQDYNVIKSETSEEEAMPVPENFMRYKNLKRKLKFLIYVSRWGDDAGLMIANSSLDYSTGE